MAQINILNAVHQSNDFAGAAGVEHTVKALLTEDIAFNTDENFKHGGVPITYTGKLALADTADNARIRGFMYKQELGQLSDINPQFPKNGDIIPLCHEFIGEMDTEKAPGTPVYLDDTGHYNDTAGTVSTIVGRYVAYDEGTASLSKWVEFRYDSK